MSRAVISIALGAAAFAGVLGCAAPRAEADATLTMNVVMPRASSFFIGVYKPWADAVERESQGRIKIVIPAASMAPLARQWEMVTSGIADVALTPNDYLRERMGEDFTAKDFRTWHATVLAAAALAESDEPGDTERSRMRAVRSSSGR